MNAVDCRQDSDGVWEEKLKSAVRHFNMLNGTDYDPSESFLDYAVRANTETA